MAAKENLFRVIRYNNPAWVSNEMDQLLAAIADCKIALLKRFDDMGQIGLRCHKLRKEANDGRQG